MKPILATLKLRNNRLIKMRKSLGMSQPELASKADVGWQVYNAYECMRLNPVRQDGEWRNSAVKVAAFFNRDPEYLFPQVVSEMRATETSRELDEVDILSLGPGNGILSITAGDPVVKSETAQALSDAISSLGEREQTVVKMRFFMDPPATYREIGDQLGGLSVERTRQIASIAARKVASALLGRRIKLREMDDEQKQRLRLELAEELGIFNAQRIEEKRQ